jgi:hypothetical protein
MSDDREAAAAQERVTARTKKQKEHLARLSAQGKTARVAAVTPVAPGFGGHGDRGSGEDSDDVEVGALIPDAAVFADLAISAMTGWRWDRDPRMIALGWPVPIYRGRYKHRDQNQYRKFKANLLQQALKNRHALLRKTATLKGENATV